MIHRQLAREIIELASQLRRVLGLLVNRRGHITHVILGDALRLYLPDIGRLRAGEQRMRGLRLLVAHPGNTFRGRLKYGLESDLITDLEKLQLDGVLQIEAKLGGVMGLAFGHLLPPQKPNRSATPRRKFFRL